MEKKKTVLSFDFMIVDQRRTNQGPIKSKVICVHKIPLSGTGPVLTCFSHHPLPPQLGLSSSEEHGGEASLFRRLLLLN